MLQLLGLVPPVFLSSCRDAKVSSAPTIVTGKVLMSMICAVKGR
jgi:hypothetical protein